MALMGLVKEPKKALPKWFPYPCLSVLQGIVSVLLEDNVKREIPLWEREMAEQKAHQSLSG